VDLRLPLRVVVVVHAVEVLDISAEREDILGGGQRARLAVVVDHLSDRLGEEETELIGVF
jgi:hypothetical protein